LLQTCERKYYFQYLAGGRLNADTPRLRQVGLLKKLKSIPMWLGDCFHQGVAEYLSSLRDGVEPARAEVLWSLQQRIERDWRFSAQGRYKTQPFLIDKVGVALLEHYYQQVPPGMDASRAYSQVEGWMVRFLDWAATARITEEVIRADRLWIEPPPWGNDAPGFEDQGVQVVTKVDFAWERAGEAFMIYDWKASTAPRPRPPFLSQHELQVGVYMLWPHLTLGIDLALIQSRLVYCGGAATTVEEHQLDPETLPLIRSTLRDSIRLTQQWTERQDSRGIGLPELNYAASLAVCRQCGFRELCQRDMLN
jgi:hypothetical protein